MGCAAVYVALIWSIRVSKMVREGIMRKRSALRSSPLTEAFEGTVKWHGGIRVSSRLLAFEFPTGIRDSRNGVPTPLARSNTAALGRQLGLAVRAFRLSVPSRAESAASSARPVSRTFASASIDRSSSSPAAIRLLNGGRSGGLNMPVRPT